jgi:hypothetical protein
VARTVSISTWGSLVVYDPDEGPPDGLRGADEFWNGEERRRPSQLRSAVGLVAYVAVWPLDGPPPGDGPLTERDLDGVALTMPVSNVCFVCQASVAGLYVDGGIPFFQPWDRSHEWLRKCPSCGAFAYDARLTGMLPMPGRGSG